MTFSEYTPWLKNHPGIIAKKYFGKQEPVMIGSDFLADYLNQ